MAVSDQMADSFLCQQRYTAEGSLDLKSVDAKYGASDERWDRMIYVHSYQAGPTNLFVSLVGRLRRSWSRSPAPSTNVFVRTNWIFSQSTYMHWVALSTYSRWGREIHGG